MVNLPKMNILTCCNILMLVIVLLVLLHVLGHFNIVISPKEGMKGPTGNEKTGYIWVFVAISVIGYIYVSTIFPPLFGIGTKRRPLIDDEWEFR